MCTVSRVPLALTFPDSPNKGSSFEESFRALCLRAWSVSSPGGGAWGSAELGATQMILSYEQDAGQVDAGLGSPHLA